MANLKVGTRLLVGFGTAIVLTAVVGIIGFASTQRLAATTASMDKNGVQALQSLAEVENALWELRYGVSQYIAVPNPESRRRIIEDSPKQFESLDHGLKQFGSSELTPEAQVAFTSLKDIYAQYKDKRPGWFELMEAGKIDEAAEYRAKTILPSGAGTVKALSTLVAIQTQAIADIEKSANTLVVSTAVWIFAITLVSLVVALLIGFWIIRNLMKQLGGEPDYAAEAVGKISAGDLSTDLALRAGDNSSLLYSLKAMQDSLRGIVSEIQAIVQAGVQGDFSRKMALRGKQGFGKDIATELNQLSATTEAGLNDVMRVTNALAAGDLTQKITKDYPGVFGQLKDDVNRTTEQLREIILDEVGRVLEAMSHGDLTEKISKDYPGAFGQLKEDANTTVEKLMEIIAQVKNSAGLITAAAQEIAQGNTDLSQRTTEQASNLEETASSMEELTSTVKQNAENAKHANQLSMSASDIAVKGGKVVGNVVDTMASISDSSKKIADIINVIEGIAFQTNILALNAAVEAARAGEQGRGFAVVASEVRSLAQRSATAAKEIKILIDDSVDKVDAGSKQVDQAGATMNEVVAAVKRVTDIMAEIAAASNEQSAGIEQVNEAIVHMDTVTQQNAALVEEASAAADSMREQATALDEAMGTFKLEERGKEAGEIVVKHVAKIVPQTPKVATFRTKNRKLVNANANMEGDWNEF